MSQFSDLNGQLIRCWFVYIRSNLPIEICVPNHCSRDHKYSQRLLPHKLNFVNFFLLKVMLIFKIKEIYFDCIRRFSLLHRSDCNLLQVGKQHLLFKMLCTLNTTLGIWAPSLCGILTLEPYSHSKLGKFSDFNINLNSQN